MSGLEQKIQASIKLLRKISEAYGQEMAIGYSGGKDSDLCVQLAKEAGIPWRAYYCNTTIDPPGTIAHGKAVCGDNYTVIQPRNSWFAIVRKRGFPNRWQRHCCSELKERYVAPKMVLGIRREESVKRAARYTEPTLCRIYRKDERTEQVFPLLDWDLQDVEAFIRDRGIRLHDLYYPDGNLDVSKRLGCMACPLASQGKRRPALVGKTNFVKAIMCNGAEWTMRTAKMHNISYRKPWEYAYGFLHGEFSKNMLERLATQTELFPITMKQRIEDEFQVDLGKDFDIYEETYRRMIRRMKNNGEPTDGLTFEKFMGKSEN